MIQCTCDACGRIVPQWSTLNLNMRSEGWNREICNDCYKTVLAKAQAFIDDITVTQRDDK